MSSWNPDLVDFRRQVADAYARYRQSEDVPAEALRFRVFRDVLFRDHSQSALDEGQKRRFRGLEYYPYDPSYRVLAEIVPAEELTLRLSLSDGETLLKRVGRVDIRLPMGKGTLDVFWISGYGGGVFLPFGDATNGQTTYGGGRYLLDTIKGADLGNVGQKLVLDFNMAYNPSCAHNPRWVCPLAPQGNRLGFSVPVGEKGPESYAMLEQSGVPE